ncbi:MAG TPA: flagellar hook-associated protein FlgK [Janthinobacterium sp.]|nr:flagellar hook-associated protein FlgK [Janthinobacterium sp.]
MSIINNALSASLAAQAAVSASSENIANLQTPGYTRQGVLLGALGPSGARSAGNGVEVSALLRFSDAYKSQQMWRAASDQGQRSQTQPYLTQLEQVMGDEVSSISAGVDGFFRALNAAGVDPTSSPLRQQVVTAADAMAQHFNSIYNVLNNQLLSVQQQRAAILPQANTTLSNIAALNQKISASAASGANVSSLIDARDQAIDGLAAHMALEVTDQPDGSRDVTLKSGQPLVIGSLAGTLSSSLDASGAQVLSLQFSTSSFALDNVGIGGQLGGLGDFERNVLKPMQQSVAAIANQLGADINTVLAAGQTMGPPPVGGPPLFAPPNSAGLMSIVAGFSAADLAFSQDGTPGDSKNLQELIKVKNLSVTLPTIGSVLIGDADTQMAGKLGITSQQNQALLGTATTVRNQAVADWQSTSGVNKDEEAVALLTFQNMYSANMKVISVANDMFDATLAMLR